MRPPAATTSVALHAAALLGLLFLYRADLVPLRPRPDPFHYVVVAYAPPRLVRPAGGGQREIRPASKGRLPPRPTRRFYLPPMAHILNEHPLLTVQQAILLDTDVPDIASDRVGNPFALDALLSGGRGGPGGIGEGGCCGVGNQNGSRVGGAMPEPGPVKPKQIRPPVLIYKIEPDYSDEARKAKVQGVVVIAAEIDSGGRTRNIRVMRPLGLGLDERAIAAAALWRFRPATADGQPVASAVTIEVSFRLL
jgi:protein TonB